MPLTRRIKRARELLKKARLDAVVAASPQNIYYFSGTWLDSHERLQAIVVPAEGPPVLIAHEMFKNELSAAGGLFKTLFWRDDDAPLELLDRLLPPAGSISIDNQWPSQKLIGLMKLNGNRLFADSTTVIDALRMLKDEQEIRLLKESARLADRVMYSVFDYLKPGLREVDVAEKIINLFKEVGVNRLSFNPIVSTGGNGAAPHHEPDNSVLCEGDTVVLDFGGVKNYYCSDITRTVTLGEPSPEVRDVYDIVRLAQETAIRSIKPGVPVQAVDEAARRVIEDAGFGPHFTHRTGHGIGIDVHEQPYLASSSQEILQEGMVFSVEPGIYLDGKFGVRIEDIVVVTSDGAIRLNDVPRQLISLTK